MHFSQSKAVKIFQECLRKIHPTEIIPAAVSYDSENKTLEIDKDIHELSKSKEIYITGTGKASVSMAEAVKSILQNNLKSGLIIAPELPSKNLSKIDIMSASHPLPDESSVNAANKLIQFAESIPEGSTVINLISGGTSSLFCKPAQGISIGYYAEMVRILLKSGASIDEINLVRKSVSQVKAGRFLHSLRHTYLIDLIISDVPDDNPGNIGSGPTTAQQFSYQDVESVLSKYNLDSKLPESVTHHIHKHSARKFKSDEIDRHHSYIISSARKTAKIAAKLIEQHGFKTVIDNEAWSGSIDQFQQHIMDKVEKYIENPSPTALIFYGECTVEVSGSGKGGRNQELALRMAKLLSNYDQNIIFLSAGTDGVDGPTDAAGAVVDQKTKSVTEAEGIEIQSFLENNDSYHFFEHMGGHIKTGPTGNNVMDLQLLFIP